MDIKSKIKFALNYLKQKGFVDFFFLVFLKFKNYRGKLAKKYIRGSGIEIGAGGNPLSVSKGVKVKYVDYLPNKTLQEINQVFKIYKTVHIDYVCDANDLTSLGANSQDFIIANHVFEHLKNPLKSLQSRYFILKNNGIVFLTVSDKRKTFDKHREITSLDHIVDDYNNPSDKKDFDHFLQFAPISLEEKFKKNNFTYDEIEKEAGKLLKINYSIHYHVFLENIVRDIIEYGDKHKIFHFFIIDKKSTTNIKLDNEFVLILQKY